MDPLITIGVPTKNRAWCLAKVLDAIQQTDYPKNRIKLVFIDDYSTDKTWQIFENWVSQHGSKYYDVKLLRQHTNIPEARNICLAHAEGVYLLYWDSDVIPPRKDFLRSLVNTLEKDILIGAIGSSYVYEKPSLLTKVKKPPVSRYTNALYLGYTLIRYEIFKKVGGFNEEMLVGEDTEFFIRMIEKTDYKVKWAPEPVLHLRSPGARTTSPGGFLKLLRFSFKDRASGYFKEFKNLPLFLRFRIIYYLFLPISWMIVFFMYLFGFLSFWLTISWFFISLIPPLASAIRYSGIRCGIVTALTTNIPTGLALSYGILREAIYSSVNPSSRK
ncbi:MAG: glycosyltransferase [Candidatus Hodarchaeota archaeon]